MKEEFSPEDCDYIIELNKTNLDFVDKYFILIDIFQSKDLLLNTFKYGEIGIYGEKARCFMTFELLYPQKKLKYSDVETIKQDLRIKKIERIIEKKNILEKNL